MMVGASSCSSSSMERCREVVTLVHRNADRHKWRQIVELLVLFIVGFPAQCNASADHTLTPWPQGVFSADRWRCVLELQRN